MGILTFGTRRYLTERGEKGKVLSAGSWEWVGVCVHPSRQSAACNANMDQDILPRNQKMYPLPRLFLKIERRFSTMTKLRLL
jgi:hypothetical protein